MYGAPGSGIVIVAGERHAAGSHPSNHNHNPRKGGNYHGNRSSLGLPGPYPSAVGRGFQARRRGHPRPASVPLARLLPDPDRDLVVDVWQDEASFAAFGAVLGPAVMAAGLDSPPQIYPVQGFMAADGFRNP
jgi:hypothetical protein